VFEFPVFYPELAMLHLSVKDENSTGLNELLGAYALPFTSLQPGICIFSNIIFLN